MIILDASVMIAALSSADAHHSSARQFLRVHAPQRIAAHRLTIAETLVGAARAGRAAEVSSALDMIGVGRLDEPDDPVALAELRARTGLRMPDSCVLLAAKRDGGSLATFDTRLAEAARVLGIPVLSD